MSGRALAAIVLAAPAALVVPPTLAQESNMSIVARETAWHRGFRLSGATQVGCATTGDERALATFDPSFPHALSRIARGSSRTRPRPARARARRRCARSSLARASRRRRSIASVRSRRSSASSRRGS